MTRCPYPGSGCNGPKEADCVGLPACFWLSFHRESDNTERDEEMPVQFAGPEPEQEPKPEPTRISAAWDAYKAHRAHSRIDGIRHAIRALKGEA